MQLKDFLKSINDTKSNLMDSDENCEKLYTPFVVNRCLSYFPDTILHSNEMNIHSHVDHKLQYDYFLNSIRKRKRFSKWIKNEESDEIDLIKFHYGYSDTKAKEALSILGSDGVSDIKAMYGKSFNLPKS